MLNPDRATEAIRRPFPGDDRSGANDFGAGASALSWGAIAGGFRSLACSEDEDLVRALDASGASIAWSAAPRVTTSAREDGRATGGFADALLNAVAHRLAGMASVGPCLPT